MRVVVATIAFAMMQILLATEQEIVFHGQKIYVEGLSAKVWVGDPTAMDSELILVYSNAAPDAVNTLRAERDFEARMLLVGGGGAGGYGTTTTTNPGGGGGGGEVVERENAKYAAGTYTLTVGRGGTNTLSQSNGENGHPSILTFGTAELAKALGGGGGGAKGAGNGGSDVASGGGGVNRNAGGVGVITSGGMATQTNCSGGGGGAAGNGSDSKSGKAGNGGAGVATTITDGWPWYAVAETEAIFTEGEMVACGGGGGGGSTRTATMIDESGVGVDGGGHGGCQNVAAEDGKPGTGGGGGGGGRGTISNKASCFGGAGGSGVVIIRLTYIDIPIEWKPIEVSAGGYMGRIFVDENAESKWVGGDLVITYTNTMQRGGLRFFDPDDSMLPKVWAKASVLLVGGGGGGGMIDVCCYGGGAGGGAGGVVEEKGLVFDNSAEFSVMVGAGGRGGRKNEEMGGNGTSSLLTTNGVNVVQEAYGGGGGGALSDGAGTNNVMGSKIASGGGGSFSRYRDASGEYGGKGGLGSEQGHDGGNGTYFRVGAGGGGAGGAGGDDVMRDYGSAPGDGGIGVVCDITGEKLWYAGGGGGAYVNSADLTSPYHFCTGAKGGCGVGGDGAGVVDGVAIPATDGVANTGSGGGGGVSHEGAMETAGNGGSGVVIIRLSEFVVERVPVPLPDGVTEIGEYAFQNGTFTSVTIANSVTNIASTAFEGCSNIESVALGCTGLITGLNSPGLWQARFDGYKDWSSSILDSESRSRVSGVVMGYTRTSSSGTVVTDPIFGGSYNWNNSYTTFGYCGYMFMNAGRRYVFGKDFDDAVYLKVDGIVVMDHSECDQFATGSYDVTWTGWHEIEVRLADDTSTKGPRCVTWSSTMGLGWRDDGETSAQPESDWNRLMDPGDGCLFKIESCAECRLATLFPDSFAGIKSATILEGTERINSGFCAGCVALESVKIPASVKSISEDAFLGCDNLKRVDVESLEDWLGIEFANAAANPLSTGAKLYVGGVEVKELVIPDGVSEIGEHEFQCGSFISVKIPNSVTNIAATAFAGCSNIESVALGCAGLITGPNSPGLWQARFDGYKDWSSSILDSESCSRVSGVVMGYTRTSSSGTVVTDPIFGGSYNWNNSYTTFGYCGYMFMNAGRRYVFGKDFDDAVYLKVDGTVVMDNAVYNQFTTGAYDVTWTGWHEIEVRLSDETSTKGPRCVTWSSTMGLGWRDDGATSAQPESDWNRLMDPGDGSLFRIEPYAACRLETLFPDSYASIKSVTILEGADRINSGFCAGCTMLEAVTIPASATNIGENAFSGCATLQNIEIPSGVSFIGKDAFGGCESLKRVDVATLEEWMKIQFANAAANPISTGAKLCVGGVEVKELVIPDGVTEIEECEFQGGSFTSVTIPNSVTNIAPTAFAGCANLSNVVLHGGVPVSRQKGPELVEGTAWIEETETLNGEKVYRSNPIGFNQSTAIEFIIPKGLEHVVFSWKVGSEQNYDWLTWYLDGVQQGRISGSRDWELITKDLNGEEHVFRFVYSADNIVSVAPDCGWVSVCASWMRSPTLKGIFPDSPVTSVTIGEEVTELPDGFFAECAEMELVVLPDMLVTIGRDAFSGCASLEDLTLPSCVANMGANAFLGCENLKRVDVATLEAWLKVDFGNEMANPLCYGAALYASGVKVQGYSRRVMPITYSNLHEATHANPDSHEEGVEVVFAPLSGRTGYTFTGWTPAAITADMTGAQIVTAGWRANAYQIVYCANGGTGTMTTTDCEYDKEQALAINQFVRVGYVFKGWAVAEGGDSTIEDGAIVKNLTSLDGDVVRLYAVWEVEHIETPVIMPEDGAVFKAKSCMVTINCATAGATIYYTTDGTTPRVKPTFQYNGPFEIKDTTTIVAMAFKDGNQSDYAEATITHVDPEGLTLASALGESKLYDVATGGDGEWVPIEDDAGKTIKTSALSGVLEEDDEGTAQTSWMEAKVNGRGTLSFWWRVSCDPDPRGKYTYDYAKFVADGTVVARQDGDTDGWVPVSVSFNTDGEHVLQWSYNTDGWLSVGGAYDDCVCVNGVVWSGMDKPSVEPVIEGDEGATVTGDAETGFVIKPSEGNTAVEVTIPQGVDAAKVTVEVSPKVASVKPNGAKVKIVSGGADITEFLNVPAVDGNGVIDLTKATVKEEYVKEALDVEKGAVIDLCGGSQGTASPTIKTAPTQVGLFYQLREGETLGGMRDGDSKVGDGEPWTPEIKVKGGKSAFYSIGVGKGE